MTPTFDTIVALWRAGLAAGDPAPRVRLSSLAVGQLQAELPGVPSSALAGLAELPPCCVLRLDRNLRDGAVLDRREVPATEPADVAPAVTLGDREDVRPRVTLPPFRWEDVLKAMPPPPPVRPAGIPHPLGPDPSPQCATKESPTSPVNDVGPPPSTQPAHQSGQTLALTRRTGKPARCNGLRFSIAGQRPKETMNAPKKSLAMPPVFPGQVWTGRLAKNLGHTATVEDVVEDHIAFRHHASNVRKRICLHSLIGAYRPVEEVDIAAAARAVQVDGTNMLKTTATPRASPGKAKQRDRNVELPPAEMGTVVEAPRGAPPDSAPIVLRDLVSTRILEAIEHSYVYLNEHGSITCHREFLSADALRAISRNAALVSDCAGGRWKQLVTAWPESLAQQWREANAANIRAGQSVRVAAWQAFVDLSGQWKWMPSAESSPPNDTTDAPRAPQSGITAASHASAEGGAQASDTSPAVAHFGPDPLPEQAEQIEFRGHTMPGYTSRKDGSKWVVAKNVIASLDIGQDRLFRALKKADRDGAAKPHVRCSYNGRTVQKWLVSVEFLARFVDASTAKAALVREIASGAAHRAPTNNAANPACPEPSCPASLIVDAAPVDSETAGQVPDGMMLVKLNGVPVALSGKAGDEGKIIDSDLVAFIGSDSVRTFRRRLRDYEKSGDLIGLDWRSFEERQSTGNGGTRAFKVDMALLTMEQALFMVAKSNSPRANEMTRHIIGVFLEVQRRGMVQTQPQPQLDVAQVVAAAVSQTVRIVVPEILAAVRAESGASNPKAAEDAKAAESERKRKANIAKKGTETKAFNERFDGGIRKTYEPLLVRFIDQCLDPVDLRDPKAQSRCLTPEQIRVAFGEWLRDTRVHKAAILPPENRAVFTMLSILSGGVAIYAKVDGKNEVKLYPWAFKSGAIVDPRQTTIPGVGGK